MIHILIEKRGFEWFSSGQFPKLVGAVFFKGEEEGSMLGTCLNLVWDNVCCLMEPFIISVSLRTYVTTEEKHKFGVKV